MLLGSRLRRELAHAGVVIILRNERRHRRPLAEILHVVVESEIVAHRLLWVHVGVVRWTVRHVVHAKWVLLLVLLDLIVDLPIARLLALEMVRLIGLLHLERLWGLLALISLPGLICL